MKVAAALDELQAGTRGAPGAVHERVHALLQPAGEAAAPRRARRLRLGRPRLLPAVGLAGAAAVLLLGVLLAAGTGGSQTVTSLAGKDDTADLEHTPPVARAPQPVTAGSGTHRRAGRADPGPRRPQPPAALPALDAAAGQGPQPALAGDPAGGRDRPRDGRLRRQRRRRHASHRPGPGVARAAGADRLGAAGDREALGARHDPGPARGRAGHPAPARQRDQARGRDPPEHRDPAGEAAGPEAHRRGAGAAAEPARQRATRAPAGHAAAARAYGARAPTPPSRWASRRRRRPP